MHDPDVHFKRITAAAVLDVCKLSHTLSDEQRKMVADNAVSLAQAAYSDGAWVRAIYADSDLFGFIMLHLGSDYDDGIDCPGVFLWRLMIAGPFRAKETPLAPYTDYSLICGRWACASSTRAARPARQAPRGSTGDLGSSPRRQLRGLVGIRSKAGRVSSEDDKATSLKPDHYLM